MKPDHNQHYLICSNFYHFVAKRFCFSERCDAAINQKNNELFRLISASHCENNSMDSIGCNWPLFRSFFERTAFLEFIYRFNFHCSKSSLNKLRPIFQEKNIIKVSLQFTGCSFLFENRMAKTEQRNKTNKKLEMVLLLAFRFQCDWFMLLFRLFPLTEFEFRHAEFDAYKQRSHCKEICVQNAA